MRVFISKAFSDAIINIPKEEIKIFHEKIEVLKITPQKDILELEDIITLIDKKDLVLYAYNIKESTYVVFVIKEKNKLVLLDKIELIGDEIKSLVYSDVITQSKKDDND